LVKLKYSDARNGNAVKTTNPSSHGLIVVQPARVSSERRRDFWVAVGLASETSAMVTFPL
jgi:hypothetical protein